MIEKPRILKDSQQKRLKGFNAKEKSTAQQLKKEKMKKRNIKKDKKKKAKDEQKITPFDFIQLVKSDPEMADEFCYL